MICLLVPFEEKESGPESHGEQRDSVALLNEILGSLSVDGGDLSQEWTQVFGDSEEGPGAASEGPLESEQKESFFLPSQLLDQSFYHLQTSGL